MSDASFARRTVGLVNNGAVFSILKSTDSKLTISEISSKIPKVTERTVRRAVEDLIKSGFVREFGMRRNAKLYGVADKSIYEEGEELGEAKTIPWGGSLISVTEFIEMIVSPEVDPLNSNDDLHVVRAQLARGIRRAMAGVILTAGVAGQESYLDSARNNLQKVEDELRFVYTLVRSFNDSFVWFDHYRDRIGYQVRMLQKMNAELYQLATDYVRSE